MRHADLPTLYPTAYPALVQTTYPNAVITYPGEQIILPSGTVGYYNFDNQTVDQSGYENNGTLGGTAAYGDGPHYKILALDGGGYVDVAADASLDPAAGAYSMEAWIKPTNVTQTAQIIRATGFMTLRIVNATLAPQLNLSLIGWLEVAEGVITAGVWQHIAFVYTGSVAHNYVNGSEPTPGGNEIAIAFSYTAGANALYIGSDNAHANRFNGQVGITRCVNRALTEAEVLAHYNGERSIYGV